MIEGQFSATKKVKNVVDQNNKTLVLNILGVSCKEIR
jgi:hypothetical protein